MPLLTIAQASELLATNERHIRHLIATRAITTVKVGGLVRFRSADLDAYVAANTRPAVQR